MVSDKHADPSVRASLARLESEFLEYSQQEQDEIAILRAGFRELYKRNGAAAALAMMATSFEIAIDKGQL